MSTLQYFDYPGFGERSKRDVNYSQAVRIDNRIEVSGQGQTLPCRTHHCRPTYCTRRMGPNDRAVPGKAPRRG